MSTSTPSTKIIAIEETPLTVPEEVVESIPISNNNTESTSGLSSATFDNSIPITNTFNNLTLLNTPVLPSKNNEHSYATNNLQRSNDLFTLAYMNIKDAVSLIPIFNGENMPVNSFIELCKQTVNLIHPSGKLYLTQLIKSRIQGKASRYVSTPRRTLSQWQSLLSNIHQNEGESIVDFATRIKEIVQGTSEVIIDKHSGEIRTGLLASTREGARDSFVRGLRGQLGLWVASQKPLTLLQAIDLALELEKELEQRDSLFNTRAHNMGTNDTSGYINFTGGYQGGKRNNNHHKPGQGSSFKNHPAVAAVHVAQTYNDENFHKFNRKSKICYRCGGQGHIKSECRASNLFCTACGRRNHVASVCRRKHTMGVTNNSNSKPSRYY
ncbi:uncharacterized protein LOC123272882 [Cotesia glomerata]|uniref:uncharacterized protein LOC123272882 n=1 Tax=Cotesia glomerata TaxID=32391 RepID=UPI001D030606|nr:uncharacterized protein LOC123272882 [Cotesia glomerata]